MDRRFLTGQSLAFAAGTMTAYFCLCYLSKIRVGVKHRLGSSVESEPRGRRLGLLERWYVAQSRSRMHTGFCLCVSLSGKPPTQAELEAKLLKVSQRFAWLRCRVHRDGISGVDRVTSLGERKLSTLWGDDMYVKEQEAGNMRTAAPQIRVVDCSSSSISKEDVLQAETVRGWEDEDPSQPLWRVTLVRDDERLNGEVWLILSFHHLIIDGMGALQVAKAVLNDDITSCISFSGLPPPMEDTMDTAPEIRHLLKPILLDRFPSLSIVLMPSFWKGKSVSVNPDRATKLITIPLLDALENRSLVKYMKESELSLSAILIFCLCKAIGNHTFQIQVAADERERRAGIPPPQLGAYVSGPTVIIHVKDRHSISDVGRAFTRKLRQSLKNAPQMIGMTAFIRQDWVEYARDMAFTPIHNSIGISILDTDCLTINSRSCVNIQNVYLAQGRRGFGDALQVCVTKSTESGIHATLSAFPDVVETSQLQQLAKAWRNNLQSLIY